MTLMALAHYYGSIQRSMGRELPSNLMSPLPILVPLGQISSRAVSCRRGNYRLGSDAVRSACVMLKTSIRSVVLETAVDRTLASLAIGGHLCKQIREIFCTNALLNCLLLLNRLTLS